MTFVTKFDVGQFVWAVVEVPTQPPSFIVCGPFEIASAHVNALSGRFNPPLTEICYHFWTDQKQPTNAKEADTFAAYAEAEAEVSKRGLPQ
jgi:hypothetical protein